MRYKSFLLIFSLLILSSLTGTNVLGSLINSDPITIQSQGTYGNLVDDAFFQSSSLATSPWGLVRWADSGSIDAEDTAMINDGDDQACLQIHDDAAFLEDADENIEIYQFLPKKYTLPEDQHFRITIHYTMLITGGSGALAESTWVAFRVYFGSTYSATIKAHIDSSTPQPFWTTGPLTFTADVTIPAATAASNNYETDYLFELILESTYICYEQYVRVFIDYATVETTYFDNPYSTPSTPSLLSPSNGAITNDDTPYLDWGTVTDATEYRIQIDDSSSFTSPVVNTLVGSSSYTSPHLFDDTYYWRVQAYDTYGYSSSWSSFRSFTIDTEGPDAPVLVSPANSMIINDPTPLLDWNSVSEAVQYRVQVGGDGDFNDPVVDYYTTSTSYTTPAFGHLEYYIWHVQARDSLGNWGDWSSTWDFGIDLVGPISPSLVAPTNGNSMQDRTPYLDWDSVVGVAQYCVQVDDSSSFSSPNVNYYTTNTYYVTPSLGDDTYYWRVQCQDYPGNWGSWSSVWSFTVDNIGPSPPALISPTDGVCINNYSPQLYWNDVTDAVEYHVQVSEYTSFTIIEDEKYTAITNYRIDHILNDDIYYWRVCARDAAGNWGAWSVYRQFEVDTVPPDEPAITSPNDGILTSDSTPTFSWSSVYEATNYQIQIDDGSGFTSTIIDTTIASTSYTSSSLPDNVYYWRVRARDIATNWGTWSSIRSLTIDTTSPTLENIANDPVSPTDVQIVTFSCDVSDINVIGSVILYYRINDGAWNTETMILSVSSTYEVFLGPYSYSDSIDYYISASDTCDTPNTVLDDNGGLYYSFEVSSGDFVAPTISSVTNFPDPPTVDDSIVFSCEVTDSNDIQSVTLHYRINSGSWITCAMTFDSDDTYVATLGSLSLNDLVEYYITAIDNSPNHNSATEDNSGSYYSFIVVTSDIVGPTITAVENSPETPNDAQTIVISCTAIDSSGIQYVDLHYRINGGSWITVSMIITISDTYEVTIGSFNYADSIEYYIVAADDSSNHNSATEDNSGLYYSFIIVSSDLTGPTITNISNSPTSPTDIDTVTFSCELTDTNGIQSVTLYYRINGGSWITTSMTLVSVDTYEVILSLFDYDDFIEYYIVAVDNSPNHNPTTDNNSGSYYSFTVLSGDTTPPEISNIELQPSTPNDMEPTDISCLVTDTNGILSVTLYYRLDGGAWMSEVMVLVSANTYQATIGPYSQATLVEYYIEALDNSPNNNVQIDNNGGDYYHFWIQLGDTTAPTIENVESTPTTPTDEDIITIYCEVTDENGLTSVTLYYRINGGSWVSVCMTNTFDDTFETTIGPFTIADMIEYYIVAIDDSSAHNSSTEDNSGVYYVITFISYDLVAPDIDTIYHSPLNPFEGDTISIFCSVTDDSGLLSVTLHYRVDGGIWVTITMTHLGSDDYEAVIGHYNSEVTIQYYISATDNSSSPNTAVDNNGGSYYSFSVVAHDLIGPTITNVEHTPISPDYLDNVTISCTVTDDSGVSSVTLYYRVKGSVWYESNMSYVSSNQYSLEIGPFLLHDFVEYYIQAIDNSVNQNENTNDNSTSFFSFTIVYPDTIGPTIDSILYTPESPLSTDVITIICYIVDDSGIASASVHYRLNGGSWSISPLTLNSGITYRVVIGPFAPGTTIEFYVTAVDNSDNSNVATNDNNGSYYSILIQSTNPTTTTPITTHNSGIGIVFSMFVLVAIAPLFIIRRKKVD